MRPEELARLARIARARYWTALGDPERAALEPSEKSLVAWGCVVTEFMREVGK